MIILNVFVFLIYLAFLIITLTLAKFSMQNNGAKPPFKTLREIMSKQNRLLTIIKYFAYRYTIFAVSLEQKKYILAQFFSVSIYGICLLQINKLTLWPLIIAPFSLIVEFCINDLYDLLTREQSQNKQISVTSDWIITKQFLLQGTMLLWINIMLITTSIRIYYSLSNLGQLNIKSLLVLLVCDFLLIRPTILGVLAAVLKVASYYSNQIYQKYTFLTHLIISEYVRTGDYEIVVLPVLSNLQTKKQQFSPSKQAKVIETCKSNDELTSIQLFKMNKQSHRQKQQSEMKIEDICLHDKYIYQPNYSIIQQFQKMKNQSEEKSSELNDFNKENLDTISIHQQNRQQSIKKELNEDIYLAENFFPTKNEQTLPVNINLSPVKQRKKSKQNKNRRILMLNGNSPYLEYLPNMLKKQESEHRFKSRQKQRADKSILGKDGIGFRSALKQIRK